MEFLIRRFSEWLESCKIKNSYERVKGAYIFKIENIDDELAEIIKNINIYKDTNPDSTEKAILIPMKIFSTDGKEFVLPDDCACNIIATLEPVIRDYVTKNFKKYI